MKHQAAIGSAMIAISLSGCASGPTNSATGPTTSPSTAIDSDQVFWMVVKPFALTFNALDRLSAGTSTYRIVKPGGPTRIYSVPPEVRASTGPSAKEIPLTITNDDKTGDLVVLASGQAIQAQTPNGIVTVEYLSADKRRITWRDDLNDGTGSVYTQDVILYPRGIWFGVSAKYSRDPFPPDNTRLYFTEGQLRTRSLEDAMKVLRVSPSMCYTMNSNGLIVGYWPMPGGNTLIVEVVQLYINDQIPTGLTPMNGGEVEKLASSAK